MEKTVDIIQDWITTEDLSLLGQVLENVLPEKTLLLYSSLAFSDREVLYSFLSESVLSLIQDSLLPFPDMASISLSVSKIDSRDYVVNAVVMNVGNVVAAPFSLRFFVDSVFWRQEMAPELSVGESLNVSLSWRPLTHGDHAFSFIVDPDDEVLEVSEVNNLVSRVYRVLVPDLVVDSVNAYSVVVEGESSSVEVGVSNIGDVDAVDVNLTVVANGVVVDGDAVRYVSYVVGSIEIPVMGSGLVGTYFFDWVPGVAGSYSLKAVVDPLGDVFESEKVNNEGLISVVVEAKPSFTGYWIVIGIIVTLSVTLLIFRKQV
jgi:subtilase family serine protease